MHPVRMRQSVAATVLNGLLAVGSAIQAIGGQAAELQSTPPSAYSGNLPRFCTIGSAVG